jgi:cytidylate kinase
MKLIFLYGPPASGKLTIARELAARTGISVFHNHLIVDAVASVFPFGTPNFVALRESFWLTVMREAAREGRSVLFTFAPEPTVSQQFPHRVQEEVGQAGGSVVFVRLTVSRDEQERRLGEASRKEFDKMRSVELLRKLRDGFETCEANMPSADLIIDTTQVHPRDAALTIAQEFGLTMCS